MMSVAAPSTRPTAEPRSGALPSTRTVPSRRTSHPPLPSGRIATSTTAEGRGGGMDVDGEIHEVVVDGSVVVVGSGPDHVVALGRVVDDVGGRTVVTVEGTTLVVVASAGSEEVVVDSCGRVSP